MPTAIDPRTGARREISMEEFLNDLSKADPSKVSVTKVVTDSNGVEHYYAADDLFCRGPEVSPPYGRKSPRIDMNEVYLKEIETHREWDSEFNSQKYKRNSYTSEKLNADIDKLVGERIKRLDAEIAEKGEALNDAVNARKAKEAEKAAAEAEFEKLGLFAFGAKKETKAKIEALEDTLAELRKKESVAQYEHDKVERERDSEMAAARTKAEEKRPDYEREAEQLYPLPPEPPMPAHFKPIGYGSAEKGDLAERIMNTRLSSFTVDELIYPAQINLDERFYYLNTVLYLLKRDGWLYQEGNRYYKR